MIAIISIQRILFLSLTSLLFILNYGYAQEEYPLQTEIRYYGTGCFTIQRGENVLLTDPFISNPSAAKLMFGNIRTDSSYVDKYINPASFRKVKMVISAHAHYNHLMDMPYLSKYIPTGTPIIGNRTAKHLLAFYKLPQPSVAVNDSLGTDSQLGQWFYNNDSTMRTMAFKSRHAPQIAGINFLKKRYTVDLTAEPLLVSDWQEGQTLSFIVDFIENGAIGYRMFFMSSMAEAPFGLFPRSMLEEHPVDDLFISASRKMEYNAYPGPIVELAKPGRIFLVHWENSLRSKEKPFKAIDQQGSDGMRVELEKHCPRQTQIITPIPLNYY